MIELKGVTKTYGQATEPAVAGLTLQIRPGEIYGLLGPNGAGKTTTIKMMVGLLRPDSGAITINGYDVSTSASSVMSRHPSRRTARADC